jgi:hypothetical protein
MNIINMKLLIPNERRSVQLWTWVAVIVQLT